MGMKSPTLTCQQGLEGPDGQFVPPGLLSISGQLISLVLRQAQSFLPIPVGRTEGSLLFPLPFRFGVFPAEQAVGKPGCPLCTTSLATASQGHLQSVEQEQAWWLGLKDQPSENKKKTNQNRLWVPKSCLKADCDGYVNTVPSLAASPQARLSGMPTYRAVFMPGARPTICQCFASAAEG